MASFNSFLHTIEKPLYINKGFLDSTILAFLLYILIELFSELYDSSEFSLCPSASKIVVTKRLFSPEVLS
jgi:hypothetical protein